MIISCPECSTRFRVDESKIPAQGAKIRCARCKHIFAVAAPEPTPGDEQLLSDEITSAANPPETEDSSPASPDGDFGFDDFESSEIGTGTNDEFDPAAFDEDPASDADDFSFGEDYGNVSLDEELESGEEEEPFAFGEPATTNDDPALDPDPGQEEFSFTPAQSQAPANDDLLAESFAEDSSLDDISMPQADNDSDPDETSQPTVVSSSKPARRSPLSVVILFILILIVAILVAGGVLVWQNGPAGIEQLIANLTGQPLVTELEGDIRLTNLQGSFIRNRKEGEIFVIRGIAINDRKEAQAAIQVKGIIFDKNGKQLLQKTIFCGNPISDNDLRKLSYSKMEEMMGNQFGESLANLNVTPGQSIPFTIVFRKLPKTLSEFVVEVADSKPAAQ